MAQRNVEIVIGRLITDEAFRRAFSKDPLLTLARFTETGYPLTALEMAALQGTDPGLWTEAADRIDPRLQKVSIRSDDTPLR